MDDPKERYRLSIWIYGRVLGLVFLIAFASLWSQLLALLGQTGLAPATQQLERIALALGEDASWQVPTLAWWSASDTALTAMAAVGSASALLLLIGVLPGPALAVCVASYVSLVNVGGPFLRFQWDILLIEAGFASLLLTPIVVWHRPRTTRAAPALARWPLYLLLVKLVFLSGWVKLASGDPTWANLTALTYHYETQPLPNPLSYFMHHLPLWFHRASCLGVFGIELCMPMLALVPRALPRRVAALAITSLMLIILATGNYGFFNLLTIALCLPLLDDAFISRILRRAEPTPSIGPSETGRERRATLEQTTRLGAALGMATALLAALLWSVVAPTEHGVRITVLLLAFAVAAFQASAAYRRRQRRLRRRSRTRRRKTRQARARRNGERSKRTEPRWPDWLPAFRRRTIETFGVLLLLGSTVSFAAALSPTGRELAREGLSDLQGFHLFNSYGLFAVMTTRRPEILLQGSNDGNTWQSYEFPYKPGALDRAPPVVFGHMPRLDWQMWFAALGQYRRNPWLIELMRALTRGEPKVLQLFEVNPFSEAPPRFVRAVVYEYHFSDAADKATSGNWWRRDNPRLYAPIVRAR